MTGPCTIAGAVRRQLLDGPWPPKQRVLIDAWSALAMWHNHGERVCHLHPGVHAPAMAPDLRLASAPIRHPAMCYVVGREEWIIVARVPERYPIPVDRERVLAFRQPILVYLTEAGAEPKRWAAGFINLWDKPTPRDLRLHPGISRSGEVSRALSAEEVAEEGVRLAKVLPWFFHAGEKANG